MRRRYTAKFGVWYLGDGRRAGADVVCNISGCGGYKSFEGKADVTCNDGVSYRDVTEKEAMDLCAESGGIAGYQLKRDD